MLFNHPLALVFTAVCFFFAAVTLFSLCLNIAHTGGSRD